MISITLALYWISFLILGYTYLGYGILMWVWAKIKRQPAPGFPAEQDLPTVTIIIPAYNEAGFLGPKLRNTLQLQYPRHLLRVLVVTDGSTDGSDAIARAFPQAEVLHDPVRKGKASAINTAMQLVSSEVVVLTDANTKLSENSLLYLVSHYQNPAVGGVSGEKKLSVGAEDSTEEAGEGLYWRYESFLKHNDAIAGTLVGAAGELFSFQSRLFKPLESDTILDDFVLSLRICLLGYKVAYASEAVALEAGSASIAEEQRRKVRIAAGGFQAMKRLPGLWHFKAHPLLSFQYLSHRVLRWTAAPLALPLVLLSNLFLVINGWSGWYGFTAWLQVFFYGAACIGWLGARNNTKWPIVFIPYYFLFMNWAVALGYWLFRQNKLSGLWEKSDRKSFPSQDDQKDG